MLKSVVWAAVLVSTTSLAFAETETHRGKRHGPPLVAFEACEAQIEGDACSFVGRRDKQRKGICQIVRDEQLVCVPEGHRSRHKDNQTQ